MRLTLLDGVGETKADRLKEHGYMQAEDVAFATISYFEDLSGMSTDLIRNAQEMLEAHPAVGYKIDQPRVNRDAIDSYYCNNCGQQFSEGWILEKDDHLPPHDKQYIIVTRRRRWPRPSAIMEVLNE